jgi:hypothetical protein
MGMRRGIALVTLTVAFFLVMAPVIDAGAATQTQTQVCPLPVVGGDPDTVTLSGPVGMTWTMTASESPGEPSHIVSISVLIQTAGGPLVREESGIGMSPVSVSFNLAPGHHYTIQWLATFDFGPHVCTPLLTGQSPFQVDS